MDENQDNGALLPVKVFIKRSGLKAGTVENLIRNGKVPCFTEGGVRYIPSASLSELTSILGKVPVKPGKGTAEVAP